MDRVSETDGNDGSGHRISGVKRPRTTLGEEQPSVRVIYNNLTRESKHKLEELLQQWSQWSDENSPSLPDSEQVLQSGEETYFPALCVGLDKPSSVLFWMDNVPELKKNKEFTPFDANSVPLYDRGFSFALSSTDGSSNLEGGVEIANASRCFNCGSYSHSLKDCPKPRDNAAVNIARKQHKSKRNQNAAFHNPSRYYQSSKNGKYDGLRPGVLDPETRKLLGLGELDPPPWIHRMKEIGKPPGYLDPEDEDPPSGITIFGDEEIKEETEEGEILGSSAEPPKKTNIPVTNAPIPNNVEKQRRTASRAHTTSRNNHTLDPVKKGHYLEQHRPRDMDFELEGPLRHRFWDRDNDYRSPPRQRFRDLDGYYHQRQYREFECAPMIGPPSYRYRDYDSNYIPMDSFRRPLRDIPRRSLPVDDHSFFHNLCSRRY